MLPLPFNVAQKMIIIPFRDSGFKTPASAPHRVLINPETYTYKYKTEYSETQGQGSSRTELKFSKMLPQEFNFDFLFDATGVVKTAGDVVGEVLDLLSGGVESQLEKFKRTVLEFKGDSHRPWNLMLLWGTLIFKGVLTSLDIEYKLFGPDGTPLRAIARCCFKGSLDDLQRLLKDNLMSPDVTHQRTFKSSDKLPLLVEDIYTDQSFYIDVARTNGLDTFRYIKPGTSLHFLPLE